MIAHKQSFHIVPYNLTVGQNDQDAEEHNFRTDKKVAADANDLLPCVIFNTSAVLREIWMEFDVPSMNKYLSF